MKKLKLFFIIVSFTQSFAQVNSKAMQTHTKDTIDYCELDIHSPSRNGYYLVATCPLDKKNIKTFSVGKLNSGLQDSIWIQYYRDTIISIQSYQAGIIERQTNYFLNGAIRDQLVFNGGHLISATTFNEVGLRTEERHCHNPKKHDLFKNAKVLSIKYYNDTGNTYEIENYKQKAILSSNNNYYHKRKRFKNYVSFYQSGQVYEKYYYWLGLKIKKKKYIAVG